MRNLTDAVRFASLMSKANPATLFGVFYHPAGEWRVEEEAEFARLESEGWEIWVEVQQQLPATSVH